MIFKAARAIFHSGKTPWIFYGVFAGIPLLLVLYLRSHSDAGLIDMIGLLACLMYCFVIMPAMQFFGIKRAVAQNPSMRQLQRYEFSPSGIRNHSEGMDMSFSWNNITNVKKSQGFLLCFLSRKVAHYIPEQLLSENEINQIHSWNNASGLTT